MNDADRNWFFLLCSLHLLIWTLLPSVLRQNLRTDTMENLGLGRMWQWGYAKHPPLSQWLTAFVTDLFGTVGWPVYLLGQLCVVISFYAVWRLAKNYLTPLAALASVILLEGIYFYNLDATQFNQNVLMLPLWALSYLTFFHALTRNKMTDWIGLGIFSGLAMLAKYESILLLAAIFCVLVATPQGRQAFKNSGLYIAIIIGLMIIMPNLLWLINHDFASFHYASDRLATEKAHLSFLTKRIIYPGVFIVEAIGAIIPTLLLFILISKNDRDPLLTDSMTSFKKTFLNIMFFVPIVSILLFAVVSGSWLHSLWSYPFFSLLGIVLLFYFGAHMTEEKIKRLMIYISALTIIFIFINWLDIYAKPYLKGSTNSQHLPAQQIADDLTNEWHVKFHRPLFYIASYDRMPMLNISVLSSDHPIPYYAWGDYSDTWVNKMDVIKNGAIFTWNDDCQHFPAATKFPHAKIQAVHYYRYLTGAAVKPMALCVAFLEPLGLS